MNVEAIWLRTDPIPEVQQREGVDPSQQPQLLRVLVKLQGETDWRVAIEYRVEATGMLISHITEGHALDVHPIDLLTAKN